MTRFDLSIGEGKMPFNVGIGFLGHYQDIRSFSFNELIMNLESNPFKYIPDFMFESMDYACKRKSIDNNFTNETFVDWIDDNGGTANKQLKEFSTKLIGSLNDSLPEEDGEKEGSKKK